VSTRALLPYSAARLAGILRLIAAAALAGTLPAFMATPAGRPALVREIGLFGATMLVMGGAAIAAP